MSRGRAWACRLAIASWIAAGAAVPKLPAQAASPIRWGADAEGGVPYQFQDPRDPTRIIGFEVDIIEAIAGRLGRPAQFVQNQWDGLIPGLQAGNYDLVISGIEITADRAGVVGFSRPYYVTWEQLVVRGDDSRIAALDDCRGRNVGTLKVSLAERILQGASLKI